MVQNKKGYVNMLLILIGIVFVVIGIYRGEVFAVLSRGINICLECVGIG